MYPKISPAYIIEYLMFEILSVTPHPETMKLYRPDSIGIQLLLPGISNGGVTQG